MKLPVFVAILAATSIGPVSVTAVLPPRSIVACGAIGDGVAVNTRSIQTAIDECTANGGGEVLVTAGRFVTGTLYLRDNVILHVSGSGVLLGSTNASDYATDTHRIVYANESYMDKCLIFARGATNIAIVGQGVIDGRGGAPLFKEKGAARPMLLRFMECSGVRMRDVTLLNPASWTTAWLYCRDIAVDGINISSRVNLNGDGLDFDGCENVRVSNCAFDNSDDSICLQGSRPDRPCRNIVVNNCTMSSRYAAVRIGLSSMALFENVVITGCIFRDVADCGLKIQVCEGGVMRNMLFADLVMRNVARPVLLTFNSWRLGVDTPNPPPRMQSLRGITFANFRIDNSDLTNTPSAIVVNGVPGHLIEDVVFDNITYTLPGGGTTSQALVSDIPDFVDRRPEFGVFGKDVPFTAFYLRHVRGIALRNVRLEAARSEDRPAMVFDDVTDLDLSNVWFGRPFTGTPLVSLCNVRNAVIRDCRMSDCLRASVQVQGHQSHTILVDGHNKE